MREKFVTIPNFTQMNNTTRPDLSRLLTPNSIAIIGASTNTASISGQPLRLMLDAEIGRAHV